MAGVLALLVAVVAVVLLDRITNDQDAADGPTAASSDASPTPDRSAADQSPADRSPASSPQPVAAPGARVAFVDGYFDTVPDDPDAGWAMLSPAYQAQTGRSSYDGFWSTVASVDATDLAAGPDGRTVEATVTYVYEDGRTVEERQRLRLVGPPTGSRIDGYDTL